MVLRFIASISLISICLAMAVGGDVLHQLHHLVADGFCLGHSTGYAPSTGDETLESCSHSHLAHQPDFGAATEHLNGTNFPVDQEPENKSSDSCSCYVVSQASDTASKVFLNANNELVCFLATALEQWYLQSASPKFLVRGLPAFLSHRS